MNVFIRDIDSNTITSLSGLKSRFREYAKKVHPDVSTALQANEKFDQIKNWYEEAEKYLITNSGRRMKTAGAKDTAEEILRIFSELVPGNFPIDASVRSKNKKYLARVNAINAYCNNAFVERDIFIEFENELNGLKGHTTVSNHPYNVVKLYIYRYNDYRHLKTPINRNYLVNGYALVMGILQQRNMQYSVLFLNWLLMDLIDPDARMGEVPVPTLE